MPKTNFKKELIEIEKELDEIVLILDRGGLGQFEREALQSCQMRLIGRMGDVMDAETIANYRKKRKVN